MQKSSFNADVRKLRGLYADFLRFKERNIVDEAFKNFGVVPQQLKRKTLKKVFTQYYRMPFLSFLKHIKDLVYSKNVYYLLINNNLDLHDLWYYLHFLQQKRIINIEPSGKAQLLSSSIRNALPQPKTAHQIKTILKKKLQKNISSRQPAPHLFNHTITHTVQRALDQYPITQQSAIVLIEKILQYLPLKQQILFVGDDDYLSPLLTLVDQDIGAVVVDADGALLQSLRILSKKYDLKIETQKTDIQHPRIIRQKFCAFVCNPIYTEDGAKAFLRYGLRHLGKDGGFIFLQLGDEVIGNRFLFLQKFFTENNLIIRELLPGIITYPLLEIHPEESSIRRKLKTLIHERIIKKHPSLSASLYILEYIPFDVKPLSLKQPLYAYL